MIGLDTNVVVRYLTLDDPSQFAVARRIMRSLSPDAPGYISLVVVVELVWVLRVAYHFDRKGIANVIAGLLQSNELVIEDSQLVSQALRIFQASHADFTDCLIERCGHAAECEYTVTFDKGAAAGAGMRLLT